MSTKEYVYSLIDCMSEAQLKALAEFITSFSDVKEPMPNAETLEALNEVEDMKRHPEKYKGYDDVDEMFKELLA